MTDQPTPELLRRAAEYLLQSSDGEVDPFELDEAGVRALAALLLELAAERESRPPSRIGLAGPGYDELAETLARAILPDGAR